MTKEEALKKIEELKKYVSEEDKKVEKVVGVCIKTRLGSVIFQSTKTTYKEAIIEKGNADLSDANLYGAYLYGANLSNADLSNADLSDADLSDANLYGANLYGANLRDADLYGANLRGANLYGANLYGAELCNAKFYGRGGTKKLTKAQLPDFLNALGFQIED